MKKFYLVLSVIAIALVIAIGCESSQETYSPQPTAKECNKPNEQPVDSSALELEPVRAEITAMNHQDADKTQEEEAGETWLKK